MGFADALCILAVCFFLLVVYPSSLVKLTATTITVHTSLVLVSVCLCRMLLKVYRQIWRFAGSTEYMRLMAADFCAGVAVLFVKYCAASFQGSRFVCPGNLPSGAFSALYTGDALPVQMPEGIRQQALGQSKDTAELSAVPPQTGF